jgi:cold shock CspA family protein
MIEGKIINVRDRFCFIDAAQCKGIFAHRQAFDRAVVFDERLVGQDVSFELEMSEKGPRTSRVYLAANPESSATGKGKS